MPELLGIRKYLTDRGYKDSEIGYDPKRSSVLLKGKDFFHATPQSDNHTYGTADQLDAALGRYRNNGLQDQTFQSLSNLQSRAAQTPFVFQAPQPFSYDPETDPQYQAALRTATQNAQSASNQNMAEMNRRGILDSTITSDRGARIQQQELGKVTDQVLPQLLAQKYRQYVDNANRDFQVQQANYGAGQDQFRNLSGLLGVESGLAQQGVDNQFRTDRAVAADLQQGIDNKYRDDRAEASDLDQLRNFDINKAQLGISQANSAANIANMRADNARQDKAAKTSETQKNYESQVLAGLSEFDNADDALGWLQANAGDIAKNLGAEGYNQLLQSLPTFYGVTDTSSQDAALRKQAISLAQSEPTWNTATTAERQTLIDQYVRMLNGSPGINSNGGVGSSLYGPYLR